MYKLRFTTINDVPDVHGVHDVMIAMENVISECKHDLDSDFIKFLCGD